MLSDFSALNRKRRPQVVGAAWLKDCRDAATHLGEEPYLVDMEDHCMYNTGTKRKTIRVCSFGSVLLHLGYLY